MRYHADVGDFRAPDAIDLPTGVCAAVLSRRLRRDGKQRALAQSQLLLDVNEQHDAQSIEVLHDVVVLRWQKLALASGGGRPLQVKEERIGSPASEDMQSATCCLAIERAHPLSNDGTFGAFARDPVRSERSMGGFEGTGNLIVPRCLETRLLPGATNACVPHQKTISDLV